MGARYLANMNTKEIHDLEADITSDKRALCKLDEIKEKHKAYFYTKSGFESLIKKIQGYNGCKWCLPGYHTD